MSDVEEPTLDFVCPACGESLEVNDSMKAVLLEKGCVICGTNLSNGAFSAKV